MPTRNVVLTDHQANVVEQLVSSGRYQNASEVLRDGLRMIETREATGTWTFSFLGATLDAVDVAEKMSIRRENSIAFSKAAMQNQVWDRLGNSMKDYYDKKRKGEDIRKLF